MSASPDAGSSPAAKPAAIRAPSEIAGDAFDLPIAIAGRIKSAAPVNLLRASRVEPLATALLSLSESALRLRRKLADRGRRRRAALLARSKAIGPL